MCSTGEETNDIESLLKKLYSEGPQIVTITCGAEGAWSYDGKELFFQKALDVDCINTTGAGDAFGSTFLAAYIKNNGDINHALAAGIVNSSKVIQKIGAQNGLVDWETIQNIINTNNLI